MADGRADAICWLLAADLAALSVPHYYDEDEMTHPDETYAGGLLQPQVDPYETYCLSIDGFVADDKPVINMVVEHGLAVHVDRKGWVSDVPSRQHQVGSLVFLEQTQREPREGQTDEMVKWLTHAGLCLDRKGEGDTEKLHFRLYKLGIEVPAAAMYAAQPATRTGGLPVRALSTGSTVTFRKTGRKAALMVLSRHAAVAARRLVAVYASTDLVAAYWTSDELQALAAARDWNERHRKYVDDMVGTLPRAVKPEQPSGGDEAVPEGGLNAATSSD